MYGSDAGKPMPSLYTKGLSPLCDIRYVKSLATFHVVFCYGRGVEQLPVVYTTGYCLTNSTCMLSLKLHL